jgi:hypothetical protein
MADPIVTHATGVRVEHYGQHDPKCFACKLKTLSFGRVEGGNKGPATHNPNSDKRWENDPVKQRMEELQGTQIDTDELNRRRVDLQKENK